MWTALFQLKEFRVKIFQSIVFFLFLLQSDSEFASEMQKEFGVTDFVSEHDEVCGKLLWFRQISAQGFIVKNIEGESMEANDLSHTFVEAGPV